MHDIDRRAAAALHESAHRKRKLVERDAVARVVEADSRPRGITAPCNLYLRGPASDPLNMIQFSMAGPPLRLWTTTIVLGSAIWSATTIALFFRDFAYSLYDDAYIYFTYAEHAVSGCGLRFRCDEPPVEGFSSPLYQALLVGSRLLTPDLESASQIIGSVAVLATLLIVVDTCRCAGRLLWTSEPAAEFAGTVCGVAVTVFLTLHHHFMVTGVLGLETPIVALVATALLRCAILSNAGHLRILLCVAFVTRPECAVFLLVAPILPEARRIRWWLPLIAFVALVGLIRALIFRDVLPNTAWAKAGGSVRHLELGANYIVDIVRTFPAILASILTIFSVALRRPAGYFLAAVAIWFLSFLLSGGDTFFYSRLAVPLIPGMLILSAFGIVALVQRVIPRPSVRTRFVLPVASAVLGLVALSTHARIAFALPPTHGFDNVQRWGMVAAYLSRKHAGDLVAVVPVGVISYKCSCRILDLVGLTSRAIARARRTVPEGLLRRNWIGHERHNLEWTLEQRPDLIVMTAFGDRPFEALNSATAGFFAEWLLLREIKEGRAPYNLISPEVAPGVYWLMFERKTE